MVSGFRRAAVCAGSFVTLVAISFESSGGTEPEFPSIYNRRLTADVIESTRVYEAVCSLTLILTRNV